MMGHDETPMEFNDLDRGDGEVRARFEWSTTTTPSTAVVETVAAATGRDPTAIDSLYERVDPDALDALVSPRSNSAHESVTVSFSFAERSVTVHRNGEVVVRPDGLRG